MLRSNRCHLQLMSREQLVAHGEEGNEKGGYFICKGSEKVSCWHPARFMAEIYVVNHSISRTVYLS